MPRRRFTQNGGGEDYLPDITKQMHANGIGKHSKSPFSITPKSHPKKNPLNGLPLFGAEIQKPPAKQPSQASKHSPALNQPFFSSSKSGRTLRGHFETIRTPLVPRVPHAIEPTAKGHQSQKVSIYPYVTFKLLTTLEAYAAEMKGLPNKRVPCLFSESNNPKMQLETLIGQSMGRFGGESAVNVPPQQKMELAVRMADKLATEVGRVHSLSGVKISQLISATESISERLGGGGTVFEKRMWERFIQLLELIWRESAE